MDEIEEKLSKIQFIYDIIINFLVNYSFQLLGALIVLTIGLLVANRVSRGVRALCERKALDTTLSRFIANVVKILVVTMIAIICLNMIGISITPFVAAIGALSLGAGLALQGLLSNYGAGLNIILTRPFTVDDTIQVQGVGGQVKDILLAHTILTDEDGVEITIPNKHIVGEILHNSKHVTLVELSVGVAYSSDIDSVLATLAALLDEQDCVSKEPAPQVGIEEFGDSSVNIQLRFWTPTHQLMSSRFAMNKCVWDTLKENGVEIPFPQREVSISQAAH